MNRDPALRSRSGPAASLLRWSLRSVRRDVALCVVAGLLWQAVAVTVPWVLERAVDNGLIDANAAALRRWVLVLVLLGVVRWIGDAARHWWVERAGAHAADRLRRALVDALLSMNDDTAARHDRGDLASRAVTDTDRIWAWIGGLATLVTASFTLIAVVAALAVTDPLLATVGLVTVPLSAWLALRHVAEHRRLTAASATTTGAYSAVLEPAIAGASAIKGLGAEHAMLAKAADASETLRTAALSVSALEARWLAAAAAIPAAGVTVGVWIGGQRALDGTISVGTLVAFAGWMALLVDSTVTLTERLVTRGSAHAAAARLAAIIPRTPVSSAVRPHQIPAVITPSAVALNGVQARRGERVVLRDVDLDVAPAIWLGVIGATASGKTTLLRIISGLDDPACGVVHIGDRALATLDEHTRRTVIAYVPQHPTLVSGTPADILRLGHPDAADDEIHAALRAACADDVIRDVGGIHGVIGDGGHNLSGGQRQRLAIAAAVLRRPPVLCLDDATSALDPETERDVLSALRRYLPTTAVVFATHRFAAAVACDRHVHLAGGSLIPIGAASVGRLLTGSEARG